jgi:hypothetical protein
MEDITFSRAASFMRRWAVMLNQPIVVTDEDLARFGFTGMIDLRELVAVRAIKTLQFQQDDPPALTSTDHFAAWQAMIWPNGWIAVSFQHNGVLRVGATEGRHHDFGIHLEFGSPNERGHLSPAVSIKGNEDGWFVETIIAEQAETLFTTGGPADAAIAAEAKLILPDLLSALMRESSLKARWLAARINLLLGRNPMLLGYVHRQGLQYRLPEGNLEQLYRKVNQELEETQRRVA